MRSVEEQLLKDSDFLRQTFAKVEVIPNFEKVGHRRGEDPLPGAARGVPPEAEGVYAEVAAEDAGGVHGDILEIL